jgi:hypothetical protein
MPHSTPVEGHLSYQEQNERFVIRSKQVGHLSLRKLQEAHK